jgi:prolyl oligopeptidase
MLIGDVSATPMAQSHKVFLLRAALLYLTLTAALILAAPASFAQTATPPVAPIHPFVTNYYGTLVTDNYRWMETPNSQPLAAYMKGQNTYTRAILDSLPGRAALLREITADNNLLSETDSLFIANGKYFYLQSQPGQNTAKLYMRDAATGATKLLIDPDRLAATGIPDAINWYQPSQDGRYLAYGVSAGGSEDDTMHVINTETLADQGIAITRVDGDSTDSGDLFLTVSWLPDDTLAYYRRQQLGPHDDPTTYYFKSRVWLHHLGQHAQAVSNGGGDTPIFGYNLDKSVPVALDQDATVSIIPGCAYAFGVLTENESSDNIDAIYAAPIATLQSGHPAWRQIAGPSDDITKFDAAGNSLYLLTYKNAPRYKVLETNLANPNVASAKVIVPQTSLVIRNIAAASDGLTIVSSNGGFSELSRLAPNGKTTAINLPYPSTIDTLTTSETAPGAVFSLESWTRAALWYQTTATGAVTDTGVQKPSAIDTSALVSREVTATSYDGTQIPLSIIMKNTTKLNGKNPALLEGYGAYGIEYTPYFSTGRMALLNRGGIIAFAHVRGGGWYGEAWHEAGMKLTKINTIFDFIACAQYLEDNHYTSPAYLAGEGGSAGGITIGGAIDWAPNLFAAAIDSHGETDNLRSEFTPNGPPNIGEFGSVTTPAGFHGLYAMSPYVHVRDGTKYPAVLLQTGINDPRVEPWEVAKMAARLQAATASNKPILLSVSYDSGHGMGNTKAQDDADWADELSFILWQTGNPAFQPNK